MSERNDVCLLPNALAPRRYSSDESFYFSSAPPSRKTQGLPEDGESANSHLLGVIGGRLFAKQFVKMAQDVHYHLGDIDEVRHT